MLLGVTHRVMSQSFFFEDIPQIFCKSCAAFLKFTLLALTKTELFGFYNDPYSGKETVLYASLSKNAFLPGTALGSNMEDREEAKCSVWQPMVEAAFATPGRGFQIIQKRHLLSHLQTSFSRYLIESVFLINHPQQASIQAAGTRWVGGQHSCKHTAVLDS